jgi:hypothetical protein
MAKQRFSLVLPDFADLFANELNRALLPEALLGLLKKARFESNQAGYYQQLITLFSPHFSQADDLPVAQLRGGSEQSLCADPCYLHPDRDQLLLFYRDLDLTLDEARAIACRIQPLLDDFHARLEVVSADEWLLEMDVLPEVMFTPREGLNSLPVSRYLPRGKSASDWIRLGNEIQMLLFDCPENQQREEAGKVPINNLWFWGKGALPALRAWPLVSGDETVLQRLSAKSGSAYQREIQGFADVNAAKALHVQRLERDADWESQLQTLTEHWLLPAVSALKTWRLRRLEIIVPEWGCYHLSPLSSWYFWR